MTEPDHSSAARAAAPDAATSSPAAPAAGGTAGSARRRFLVAGMMAGFIIAAASVGSPIHAQETVPGPWGDIIDPVKPLQLETAEEKVRHVRRQQMRALSAHFRSIEAIAGYGAPEVADVAANASALASLSAALPVLFGPEWRATSGSRGARPEIWTQRDRFEQHVAGFQAAAARLAEDARTGLTLSPALTGVRHQCLACHQSFRAR